VPGVVNVDAYLVESSATWLMKRLSTLTAMPKSHIIISGTGRAGTTFLIQLLTAMGLDTGFTDTTSALHSNCNAGMEREICDPDAPYIIKSPWLCNYLDDLLEGGNVIIDHAFIPIRDLYSAAESRRDVTRRAEVANFPAGIPGGLWQTEVPEDQEAVLASQLYKIIYTIAKRDIPVTLLHFPRFVNDAEYLYHKIRFLSDGIDYQSFLEIFKQVAQPELIHDFTERSTKAT
jgi:hypothetical protein